MAAPVIGLALIGALASALPAAEPSTLKLRDGSTITGEVVSLVDGVYTVKSPTLGTLTVKAADVSNVANGGEPSVALPATASPPSQLGSLSEQMANDPATMKAILALQDDPEMMAILEDPEVIDALETGDLNALLSNPKLGRLVADPRVQEITKRVAP